MKRRWRYNAKWRNYSTGSHTWDSHRNWWRSPGAVIHTTLFYQYEVTVWNNHRILSFARFDKSLDAAKVRAEAWLAKYAEAK